MDPDKIRKRDILKRQYESEAYKVANARHKYERFTTAVFQTPIGILILEWSHAWNVRWAGHAIPLRLKQQNQSSRAPIAVAMRSIPSGSSQT